MSFIKNLRNQKLLSSTLLVFTLSTGIVIGTLVTGSASAQKTEGVKDAKPLTIPNPTELSTAFTQLAKQLEPSVVYITSTFTPPPEQQSRMQRRRPSPSEEDDEGGMEFFRRFFGQDPFGGFPEGTPFRRRSASGSGFVVDRAGYILTNFHVVRDANRIQVKFNNDPTEYNAKLIGSDPETDLAIIKVETNKPLTPAKIGNSDGVQVGDWCVAIGSPFGFQASVTAGIVSAKGREISGQEHQLQRFIQTDAAINPGNSGGPLLDIQGRVIGINTAIATESGGYQGIGFALPINMAVNVYNQIIQTGRVSRGSIGIQFQADQNPVLLRALGLDHGVAISEVQAGGPAEKAGLKPEDVIIALDGQPVKDGDDLVNRVSATPVGSEVTVTIMRRGKRQDVKVRIAERSEVFAELPAFRRARGSAGGAQSSTSAKFGIDIRPLTQAERDRLELQQNGVMVDNVVPGSFADDIGLLRRDVIVSINGKDVSSVEDVQRIQATLKPGDAVAFRILRGGGQGNRWRSLFVAGTLQPEQ